MADTYTSPESLLKNVPPHSLDAERAVLGAVLIDARAIDEVAEVVLPSHFYKGGHAAIYEAVLELWKQDQPVDVVLVNEELSRKGLLEQVGGTATLVELTEAVPTSANATYYAEVVRDYACRRQLIQCVAEIQKDAFEDRGQTEELLDRTERRLFEVTQKRIRSEAVPVASVVQEAFERLETLRKGGGLVGVPSGFSDLDDLTQGFQPGEMTILAARPSMGKCLAWDTEVLLADGRVATMAELYSARDARLLTLGSDWRFRPARPSGYLDDGHKPVFRVTTRLGRRVTTTLTHPFLTPGGWRPLGELAAGARIAVPRRLEVFGDRPLRDCEVRLLGLLLGDGGLTGSVPRFTSTSPALARDFQEAVHQLEAAREDWQGALTRWLTGLGFLGAAAAAKFVPEPVFTLPRAQLALFLNRLFATDGWISVLAAGQVQVGFASTSERLARQVQHLLLRFGIVARLKPRRTTCRGREGRAWQLDVTHRESLDAFLAEIGALGKERAAQRARAALARRRPQANHDHVPEVWDRLAGAKGAWADVARAAGLSAAAGTHLPVGRRAPSRERLLALATALGEPELSALATSDVYWDEIVAIEPLGLQQVYDLEVPKTHNFVAGDVCVHNTTFALNILRNVTVYHGRSAVFFSLEMPRLQVTTNLLCGLAKIDGHRLRGGYLTREEERQFLDAAEVLMPAQLYIDDTPGLSTMDLRAKARRLKAQHNIDMIMIDYLQLMSGSAVAARESRQQEVSEISRMTKALARELSIPIVALAQLSRKVEERKEHKPMMSDLRESGCLTGESLVTLTDGSRTPIRELVGRQGVSVWSLDPATHRLVPAQVTRAFSTGVKPVLRLRTGLGREIRATANHRFLTLEGWRRLDELSPGDRIALPRKIPHGREGREAIGVRPEVRLLAHLIGDGCTLPRRSIQYTTRELELAEEVVSLAQAVFGGDVRPRVVRERSWLQVYLPTTRKLTHGVRSPVSQWLEREGVFGKRSYEKRVPPHVFTAPTPTIAAFLRHLWATDGCVHVPRRAGGYPAVYYATSSPGLASDVQALLLHLGINALRRRVEQRNGRPQFHVVVSGRDEMLRFAELVGAVGARRRAALDEVKARLVARRANTNRDVIPALAWRMFVLPAMRAAGITDRQFQAALGQSYCGAQLYDQPLSRERAARAAKASGSEALGRLAGSDIYWDEVVSSEPDGEEEVFDLTVPGPHNFLANEVVVHNSIEQDADLIMLLHRPGYYEPDKEELKNQALVIVAKNRNGPIGEVPMLFFNNQMRFESSARS